ncbi:MAG: glycosyltransferase family 4 protein [Candidatus Levyibacteriota bacterium]
MPNKKPERKKILFVGNCQSVHLERWVEYFKGEYTVSVLSPTPCEHRECVHLGDVVPRRWKWLSSIPKVGFFVRAFFFHRYLLNSGVDLVHIHQLGGFEVRVGAMLSFFGPHLLIVSTWGSDVADISAKRKRYLKRYVLQKAEVVTTTSKFLANETRSLAPGMKRLEVVPFGIDLKIFDPSRFKTQSDGNILRIGFFKHLKPIYGPDYLLRAFAVVLKKFPRAELFLAGKGEMDSELKNLAKELGISRKVRFLGFVDDVAEIMVKMDLTAMPSLRESFGVAALESQALEVPVVASRVGGTPEVIRDGETGFLVPPRDEKLLAEAMIKLLSDKELRLRMGKAGRKFVQENYNWENNASKMATLYKEMLSFRDL